MIQVEELKKVNNTEKVKEISKVYFTNDLDMFTEMKGNRIPNLSHIRKLTFSMTENGVLMNPIIVNEYMQVVDGQHRLQAAKEIKKGIYFIIAKNYTLKEVHTLNLNQKNWNNKDYLHGYADMGVFPYIRLRNFFNLNNDFTLSDCILMCSNVTSIKYGYYEKAKWKKSKQKVFAEGTWEGKDFILAQEYADRLKEIKKYYDGYNKAVFVGTMLGMFTNKNFNYNVFLSKLKTQPTELVDCSNREQCKVLIEKIYNFRNRNKVNLRF
mgnify:CR=1 FL=1